MFARGRKEMTPRLLVGFAAVLGMGAGDLAALGGIEGFEARERVTYQQVRGIFSVV